MRCLFFSDPSQVSNTPQSVWCGITTCGTVIQNHTRRAIRGRQRKSKNQTSKTSKNPLSRCRKVKEKRKERKKASREKEESEINVPISPRLSPHSPANRCRCRTPFEAIAKSANRESVTQGLQKADEANHRTHRRARGNYESQIADRLISRYVFPSVSS